MASTWPRGQHRLAHREADVLDRHLGGVDAVRLREDRPLRIGAVRRRARRASCLRDPSASTTPRLLRPTIENGRLVVDHEHGLDRRARIGVAELDQRVDVAEAHVVGARRDAVDRLERAAGGVDGDVEALGLEVALVDRDHERRRRAFELAVEREFDRRSARRPWWRRAPMRRREVRSGRAGGDRRVILVFLSLGVRRRLSAPAGPPACDFAAFSLVL